MNEPDVDAIDLFGRYMEVTGVPSLEAPAGDDPRLRGRTLGIVNGSSWITLWVNYLGRAMLPGVRLVNAGNDAVQLNFMAAHREGLPCPPQVNIDLFVDYARQLVELGGAEVILMSCSTMNRSATAVRVAMAEYGVPVVQIDEPMMERAVSGEGGEPFKPRRILVVATHGPTVASTQALLQETAVRMHRQVSFTGATVEEAFELLGSGDVAGHNDCIADAIHRATQAQPADVVVLAQLSMTVFKLSYPHCLNEFGLEVLTSGETGFEKVAEVLRTLGD